MRKRTAYMDFSVDRADKGAMDDRFRPLALALGLALGAAISGCADDAEPEATRLDRLEARLDRLDERLTRAEGRLVDDRTSGGGGQASGGGDRWQELLGDMDPERRDRLRRRYGRLRERMQAFEEGADMNAEPGSPEFRRGLILEMMRQGRGRRTWSDDEAPDREGEDAPDE